jgi:hypothetical protein
MDHGTLDFSADFPQAGKEQKTMKASAFSDAQTASILNQGAHGVPVTEI